MDETHELRRGWGLILASLVGVAFGIAAYPLYSLGPFFAPLQAEFGWSRQDISTVLLILMVPVVAMSPVVGWGSDRFGPVRLIIISQVAFGGGLIALGALTQGLTSFYVIWFLTGFGAVGTLAITFNKILSANFTRHRGFALGLALAGSGLGGAVASNYASLLVDLYGWRVAYAGLGLGPLLLGLPATLIFLRRAGSAAAIEAQRRDEIGATVREALSSYRFWFMAMTLVLGSGASTGFLANLVPLLLDKGYDAAAAAGVAGTFGIAVVLGRVGSGWCLDRFWGPGVGFVFLLTSACGALLLAFGSYPPVLTILFAGMIGLSSGAEFDLCAYFVSRYFGLKHFGKIYGLQYIAFAAGGGLAAPLFSRVRDLSGSYVAALVASGIAFGVGAVLLLSLGRYPTAAKPAT